MKKFGLPPYPYDRLNEARATAAERHGDVIDMSIGAPHDAPPASVVQALSTSNAERGYPPSIGSLEFRRAVSQWFDTQCAVQIDPQHVGATVGLKEFVAGVPHWLRHRDPDRDTVLYPAVSYPSYAMGAELAHGRAVPVAMDAQWRMELDSIDAADIARASMLWVNSPGNPAGAVEDLMAAAEWGRTHGVPVISDECYIEFTWNGPGRTILESGLEGVLAVHSLSKRSNLAGVRAGFYAGDPDLVHWLQEMRKHTGAMPPGPTQAAAVVALNDQDHVIEQKAAYHRRLLAMREVLAAMGLDAPMPEGGFYLWVPAPGGDAWALTTRLANEVGLIVSPGDFYGEQGAGHVRIAVVRDDDAIAELATRWAAR